MVKRQARAGGRMSTELGPPDWRRIALIEIIGEIGSFSQVLGSPSPEYIIMLAEESPPGRTWIEIHEDFGIGEHRGVRMAHAILAALRNSADAGLLEPFRIIAGERWLDCPDGPDVQVSLDLRSVPR
jgi:hypothetical protein